MTPAMPLAEALKVIKPKRSPASVLVLESCRLYLDLGDEMPSELRHWLRSYLENEQRQVKSKRGLHMAELSRHLQSDAEQAALTGKRIPMKKWQGLLADQVGRTTEAFKKWRKAPEFSAIEAVASHMKLLYRKKIVRALVEREFPK